MRPQTILVQVELTRFHPEVDEISALRCPSCQKPFDLHQPLADQPECLLGVCDRCHDLYLVDWIADPSGSSMVLLPKIANIRGATKTD